MDAVPSNWLIPAGAIVAALIAGLFSFFNLVLSKEQKLSELRQSWIDGLREDLATYTAAMFAIEYLVGVYRHEHGDNLNHVDLSKVIHEPYMQASTSFTRILLRLNPVDKSVAQQSLISELNKMKDFCVDQRYSDATSRIPEVRKHAQVVLKAEWERVKQGEPAFRWSKHIALFVLSGAVVLGGYLAFQTRSHLNSSVAKNGLESPARVPDKGAAANKGMEPTR